MTTASKVEWKGKVNNLEVRKCLLAGTGSGVLHRKVKLCRLWSRMSPLHQPHSVPQKGWKKRPRGQQMMWQHEMKNATVGLSKAESSHLPGWAQKIPQPSGWILWKKWQSEVQKLLLFLIRSDYLKIIAWLVRPRILFVGPDSVLFSDLN